MVYKRLQHEHDGTENRVSHDQKSEGQPHNHQGYLTQEILDDTVY